VRARHYAAIGWAGLLLAIGLDVPDYFRGLLAGFGVALAVFADRMALPRNTPETTETGVNENGIAG
jgi:hypothetical protein